MYKYNRKQSGNSQAPEYDIGVYLRPLGLEAQALHLRTRFLGGSSSTSSGRLRALFTGASDLGTNVSTCTWLVDACTYRVSPDSSTPPAPSPEGLSPSTCCSAASGLSQVPFVSRGSSFIIAKKCFPSASRILCTRWTLSRTRASRFSTTSTRISSSRSWFRTSPFCSTRGLTFRHAVRSSATVGQRTSTPGAGCGAS